ncbi:MAG: hypothetical protein IKG85_02080 [Clostridia bacterium]|nr:hypothetical protein [Clostridia bacterium]
MVIFEPYIPAALAVILFVVWNVLSKPKTVVRFIVRLLFTGGCFILFNFYFMPFPLDPRGFSAIADDVLPLAEAVRLVPFASAFDSRYHLDYYFAELVLLFIGAALTGFSVNFAFNEPMKPLKNLFISFIIPFCVFAVHALIRLFTGAMYKCADVTYIIFFIAAYFIGYALYLIIASLAKKAGGKDSSK